MDSLHPWKNAKQQIRGSRLFAKSTYNDYYRRFSSVGGFCAGMFFAITLHNSGPQESVLSGSVNAQKQDGIMVSQIKGDRPAILQFQRLDEVTL